MSWFWRGFQSAIFYYVSCAPCTKFAYQRRRRKDRKRAHAEQREAEEGSYRHPSPFSTNIYWREEMLLGPGPPQKKKERDRDRERQREQGNRGPKTSDLSSSAVTGVSSADTVLDTEGPEMEQERDSAEGWNRRRYQREDEILWGHEDVPASRVRTPEVGISRAATNSSAGEGSYYARNPEVNDLHPPIVSTPMNKSQTRWMLQPPPSARVMEGKERANRSRSVSGASRTSAASSKRATDNLGRRVGEKLLGERLRQAEVASTESVALSRTSTNDKAVPDAQGQKHDRDRRLPNESRSTTQSLTSQSQRRHPVAPPISISADLRPPASRPPLETIDSHRKAEQQQQKKPSRPKLVAMDSTSSLQVLQELVSPLTLNGGPKAANRKLNALPRSTTQHLPEAAIKLPPVDDVEDRELRRWSMDI
ncbi:MAG: hypothetical protein Q9191_004782 [Dirinaria sp. TL-2023a]